LAFPCTRIPKVIAILILTVDGTTLLKRKSLFTALLVTLGVRFNFTLLIGFVVGNTVGKKASNQSSFVGEESLKGS